MNARLGFSIAAHLRPDVLIIDEVLSVGDMSFQQKCFERMLEFKRQGIAIVFVSHNLQAVATLCERALYLAGSVKALGPTSEVLEAYIRATQKGPQAESNAIEIHDVQFNSATERFGTHAEIASTAPVTLQLVARCATPLDDVTFRFMINRSTDQLMVFDGQVHRRDLGAAAEFMGEFTLQLHFRPHLVTGHYYILLWVFHNATRQALSGPQQLATFTVIESRSRAGIVDVDFSATLGTSVEVSEATR